MRIALHIMIAFIAAVAVYDIYCTVALHDSILQCEENPVALWFCESTETIIFAAGDASENRSVTVTVRGVDVSRLVAAKTAGLAIAVPMMLYLAQSLRPGIAGAIVMPVGIGAGIAAGKAGDLMALSIKAVGSWVDLTSSLTVAIPGSPAAGDRMFLFASWKDYSLTAAAPAGWTAIGSQYADGSVSAGTGSGSMRVHAWYRDWVSGDSDPTMTGLTGVEGGVAVISLWQKDFADVWGDPGTTNAAWPSSAAQTVSAVSALDVPDGAAVMALFGVSDDVTMTRGTSDIDVASGITWAADYVESPASHHSSSTELDAAVDLGYRLVTTGGNVTLRMSGTLGAAETGAVKFVVQGIVLPAPTLSSEILRPIAGLEEDAASTKWQAIDDAIEAPTTTGDSVYAEYTGTGDVYFDEKFQVTQPTPGYAITGAKLWVLAETDVAGTIRIETVRIKLNGTWYDLGVVDTYLTDVLTWYSFELTGLAEVTDDNIFGFELKIHDENWAGDQTRIEAAYLELTYPDQAQSSGFFHWF